MRQQASKRSGRSQARHDKRGRRPGTVEQLEGRRLLAADALDAYAFVAAGEVTPDVSIAGDPDAVGLGMAGADDEARAIDLGSRVFRMYDQDYTGADQLFVSSNGLITLGAPSTPYENDTLDNSDNLPVAAIAPLWDDLAFHLDGADVFYKFDDEAGRLIIEWNNVNRLGDDSAMTFQAVLELTAAFGTGTDSGDIVFNYLDIDTNDSVTTGGRSATVGIKAGGRSEANRLVVRYLPDNDDLVYTGSSVRIYTNRAPGVAPVGPIDVPEGAGSVTLTAAATDRDGDDLTYAWDLDGDGEYDDGIGRQVTIDTSALPEPSAVLVGLRVTDGRGHEVDLNDIEVRVVNVPPAAANDEAAGDEDAVVTGDVLANDTDAGADPITARLVEGPSHGTLELNGNGTFTYTPDAHFFGTDTFTYVANDGDADSAPATVTIVLKSVNDAPTLSAGASSASVNEGGMATLGGAFSDVDAGDAITLTASRGIVAAGPGGTWSWSALAADDTGANGPVTITATDSGGVTASVSFELAVANVGPAVAAGDDVVVASGYAFASVGMFADPGTDDWSATVDYGDGSGPRSLALNPDKTFNLAYAYAAPGTYQVTVRVSDDDGGAGTDSLEVTIASAAPRVTSLAGPAAGVRGQPRQFNATFEAGAGAVTTSWVVRNAAGDVVSTGTGASLEFTPSATGTYAVHFSVTDAGGNSHSAATTIVVKAVELQANGADPSRTTLAVGGTAGNNQIQVKSSGSSALEVFVDGVLLGRFSPTAGTLVYGLAGNDQVQVVDDVERPAFLFGGDGDDQLQAGGGNDVLVGGAGNDQLQGKSGRDLLIGGPGADQTQGNDNEDIIIGGYTSFDSNVVALESISAEWSRTDRTRDQRIRALTGEIPGRNGATLLLVEGTGRTVFSDGASDSPDGSSSDWVLDR